MKVHELKGDIAVIQWEKSGNHELILSVDPTVTIELSDEEAEQLKELANEVW